MNLLPNDIPDIFFESSGLPTLPPPTLIYGLKPYGIGTGECESLKSYICRLADEHRVSVKSLMKYILNKNNKPVATTLNTSFNYTMKAISYTISMGKIANDLVMLLINATGKGELINCTMLPLTNVISTNSLIRRKELHCPECLIESNNSGNICGHLLWAIECVNVCPKHKINLVPSRCGAVPEDRYSNAANKKTLWGVCSSCGSIAYLCRRDDQIKSSEIEVWKAQQIAELISCFPEASSDFSKVNLIKGLKSVMALVADGKYAILARQAGINKSVLWGWLHGNLKPRLPILLELCLAAKVSLVSVIRGGPIHCECPVYEVKTIKARTTKPTMKEREKALENAQSSIPAKSLSEVSKEIGISSKTLCSKFPELTSRIVENYKKHVATQKMEHERKAQEMGTEIMNELIRRGLSITLRNFQVVAGKVVMPDSRLHNFWKNYRINELEKANSG